MRGAINIYQITPCFLIRQQQQLKQKMQEARKSFTEIHFDKNIFSLYRKPIFHVASRNIQKDFLSRSIPRPICSYIIRVYIQHPENMNFFHKINWNLTVEA